MGTQNSFHVGEVENTVSADWSHGTFLIRAINCFGENLFCPRDWLVDVVNYQKSRKKIWEFPFRQNIFSVSAQFCSGGRNYAYDHFIDKTCISVSQSSGIRAMGYYDYKDLGYGKREKHDLNELSSFKGKAQNLGHAPFSP